MSLLFNLWLFILFFISEYWNIIFREVEFDRVCRFTNLLFLLLLHALLPHLLDLHQLILEINFLLKLHLDDQPLVIINHELVAHFFNLPSDLRMIKLGVLQLPVTPDLGRGGDGLRLRLRSFLFLFLLRLYRLVIPFYVNTSIFIIFREVKFDRAIFTVTLNVLCAAWVRAWPYRAELP